VLTDPNDAGERERHWGDQWHYALSRMVAAARAFGLRAIDGPYADLGDREGKWAIHPSQIEPLNEVFTPTEAEVERARRIIEAMREAAAEGRGAVALDGRLIDAASIRMAENVVARAEQIGRRGS